MSGLLEGYPTEATILAAAPEDLAWPILNHLKAFHGAPDSQPFSGWNMCCVVRERDKGSEKVQSAFMEAWNWLETQGLVVASPRAPHDAQTLSRRALAIADEQAFNEFKTLRQSGYDLMHAAIRDSVWALYIRRDFDTAVGRAFKEVEVTMRSKGDFATSDFGERLIKNFFNRFVLPGGSGRPGSDMSDEAKLFIGSFNLYRNPAVHQIPKIDDPSFAMEVLLLASHLLRIVEMSVEST
jgi:hypothetical protein